MPPTAALIVALFVSLNIGEVLPATFERPVGSKDSERVLLTNFNQVYAALTSGLTVSYYFDISTHEKSSSKSIFSYGGVIDTFEYFNHPWIDSYYLRFTSKELSLEPRAELIIRDHQYSDDILNSVMVDIVVMHPATFVPYEKAQFNCAVSNGTAPAYKTAYFYATKQEQPSLLPSYADVYSTLRSGFAVSYSVKYYSCTPSSSFPLATGAGFIGSYQDIDAASSNPGVQFSEMRLTTSPITGYETQVVTLYKNDTVHFNRKLQTTAFIPYVTDHLACTIDNGTNNGTVSFREADSNNKR